MDHRDLKNYGHLFPCELREIKKGQKFRIYLGKVGRTRWSKPYVKSEYDRNERMWMVHPSGSNSSTVIRLAPSEIVKPYYV